jgi:DNA-directed RNA polymerase specialized sigma24 family protein
MSRLRLVPDSNDVGPVSKALRSESAAPGSHDPFDEFVATDGLRLRAVLIARYGLEVGCDAHAEALAWAWQHWGRLSAMQNPLGYLYRVAQSATRPHRRWRSRHSFPSRMPERWHLDADPMLMDSLGDLTEAQRVSVLLVHGHQWSYAEVAEVLECSVSAVTNHVHRGLTAMRKQLAEEAP